MLVPMYAFGLTEKRNRETIERFLDTYVNREKSFDRKNERLYLLPLDRRDHDFGLPMNQYEREPAINLSHVIDLGLAIPHRAFWIYLNAKQEDFQQASLGFTADDCMVLGLGVESFNCEDEATRRAKVLLKSLVDTFDCRAGLIAVEQNPPLNSDVFWTGKGVGMPIVMWHKD